MGSLWLNLLFLASLAVLKTSAQCQNKTGLSLDSTGHVNRTLSSGRQYLLHVPQNATNASSVPLVLSFHGADDTPEIQERLSQFSEPGMLINGSSIIAAYPLGSPNTSQNRSAIWAGAPYANTSVDDVQFTKDIIADVTEHYCIDQSRVYAAGKSNGGGFVNLLACLNETSRLFAAFAPVSPALYNGTLAFPGSGCSPASTVAIITSHGLQDQTIPYNGRNDSKTGQYGVGTSTVNVPQWRQAWSEMLGCNATAPSITSEPYLNATEYMWCNVSLEAFTVVNLGHSWPTTLALDPSGAPNNTASFNLTAPAILDFFSRHSLPSS